MLVKHPGSRNGKSVCSQIAAVAANTVRDLILDLQVISLGGREKPEL
jgi:hypothetical protein